MEESEVSLHEQKEKTLEAKEEYDLGTLLKGLRVTFDPEEVEFAPKFNKLVSVLAGKTEFTPP